LFWTFEESVAKGTLNVICLKAHAFFRVSKERSSGLNLRRSYNPMADNEFIMDLEASLSDMDTIPVPHIAVYHILS
jgi:hypothetical protein